ncbi:MAG: phosphoadenosine phosphosulfate reductase family protein [Phycisphaerae bacterium]
MRRKPIEGPIMNPTETDKQTHPPAEAAQEDARQRPPATRALPVDRLMEEDVFALADGLSFKEKVDRSLRLLEAAREDFGDGLAVANSLGTGVVWHLAKRVDPAIPGFTVLTPHAFPETERHLARLRARYPELKVYRGDFDLPCDLYKTDPDRCCRLLKVEPTRRAIREMGVECLASGLRCTSGRRRAGLHEIEDRGDGLLRLYPILLWHEYEVWTYAALNRVEVNPLYAEGYRSLGCAPCTRVTAAGEGERAGRWIGTSKCGGECGIHTKALKFEDGAGI